MAKAKWKKAKWKQPLLVRLVGEYKAAGKTYWLCDDGNVYLCGTHIESNRGTLADFLSDVARGNSRCTLVEGVQHAT